MIKKIIPHIAIILTLMMITLFILNYLNPFMGFLSRGMSKAVIVLWIISLVTTIIMAIVHIIANNKNTADYDN